MRTDASRHQYKASLSVAAAVLGGKTGKQVGFKMTDLPLENSTNFDGNKTFSNTNDTLSNDPSGFDLVVSKIASALNIYYIPILIILGTIGNVVSMFVFYRSKLRLQSTSQYLSALALSDTIFLLQLLPPWLNTVNVTGLFYQPGFCQLFVYTSYVSCCISAWIVVAFTIERFVAIAYPLQRNSICTVRRSRYVITTIVFASVTLNLPVLRFASPTTDNCNINLEYLADAARFNLIDTATSFSVPLGIIIILNSWIMFGVCRLEKERRNLMKRDDDVEAGERIRAIRQVGCPRSQQRVTRMLLIVSTTYVVLNLPAYIMRIIAYTCDIRQNEVSFRWLSIQQVMVMFFNSNFGINFLLYCLSGQNFRHALKRTIVRLPQHGRRPIKTRRSRPLCRNCSISNSFISYGTDASNCPSCSTANPRRAHRENKYITRWTFNNNRQQRRQAHRGDLELVDLRGRPLPPPEIQLNTTRNILRQGVRKHY